MIPINEPWLDERETTAVVNALQSGWISGSGPFISDFEEQWANTCGRSHGIAVSSGTAALETAVHALDLEPGSEVILPTFTIIACLNVLLRQNLRPVLVDADPRTWCMDVDRIEERISPKTRAIMAVHIYGHPVDMEPLLALAAGHGLNIIEDTAEAHGARCRGRMCGSFGEVSAFSFYANKIITTGEGGMVLCDDDRLAERCRAFRNLYFGRVKRFLHDDLGYNFRLSSLQAAIGIAQIEKFPQALARKKEMARIYREVLHGIPDLQLPPVSSWADNVFWVYAVVAGESHPEAPKLQDRLREKGVETRPFFYGLHAQPPMQRLGFGQGEHFPVADRLTRRGLCLPAGLGTAPELFREAALALRQVLEEG